MGTGRSAGDITAILSFAVFLIRLFGGQTWSMISPALLTLSLLNLTLPITKMEPSFLSTPPPTDKNWLSTYHGPISLLRAGSKWKIIFVPALHSPRNADEKREWQPNVMVSMMGQHCILWEQWERGGTQVPGLKKRVGLSQCEKLSLVIQFQSRAHPWTSCWGQKYGRHSDWCEVATCLVDSCYYSLFSIYPPCFW